MIVCFNGIDGSGKTLQAQRLVARLNTAGYPAVYLWNGSKSPVTRPLIWLGKRVFSAPRNGSSGRPNTTSNDNVQYQRYLSSIRRLFKHTAVRDLWLQISLLEHVAQIWVRILPRLPQYDVIVCDRYVYDSIIGVAVLAHVSPAELPPLLRRRVTRLVPAPDVSIFLDVPVDVAYARIAFGRGSDVSLQHFLEQRAPLYRVAADTLNMQIVDASPTADEVAARVWQSVQPLFTIPRYCHEHD